MSIPTGSVYAQKVGTAGDLVVKDILFSNDYRVKDIDDLDLTSSHSYFVRDTDTLEVQETSRIVHSLSSDKNYGGFSIQALDTNSSVKSMPSTVTSTANSTIITTKTGACTFSNQGLSLDSENSSIFFGASKVFRIKFTSETPSRLLFQYLDTDLDEYITKLSIL